MSSPTKLEIRAEQVLPGSKEGKEGMWMDGRVEKWPKQYMHMQINVIFKKRKYKNVQ
jgi:hypothetical protein